MTHPMNPHLAILLLAGMLTGCQTTQQRWESAFAGKAAAELNLLQYSTRCAASAAVYTRLENIDADQPRHVKRHQLPEDEFQQLKDVLSRASTATFGGTVPESWQQADCGIILYDAGGRHLIDLNKRVLNSCSEGGSLLALPDCDMGVLLALPTLRLAKEHMRNENNYTAHCRLRSTAADKLKQALEKTRTARILLKNGVDNTEDTITLAEEEYQQLRNVLSQAQPLPPMTRTAWESPSHCISVPPLLVNADLQLLDEQGEVVHTLPLDYTCFARASEAASFREHEHNGEFAALPDALHAAFYALPFWELEQQARIQLASP